MGVQLRPSFVRLLKLAANPPITWHGQSTATHQSLNIGFYTDKYRPTTGWMTGGISWAVVRGMGEGVATGPMSSFRVTPFTPVGSAAPPTTTAKATRSQTSGSTQSTSAWYKPGTNLGGRRLAEYSGSSLEKMNQLFTIWSGKVGQLWQWPARHPWSWSLSASSQQPPWHPQSTSEKIKPLKQVAG